EVRRGSERRIPDDVEIGETREAERLAQSVAAGGFDVEEEFPSAREADAGVEREHARQRAFRSGLEALSAAVARGKVAVGLCDEIDLAADPQRRVVRMRKNRRLLVRRLSVRA